MRYLGPDGLRRSAPHTFGDKASAETWLARIRTQVADHRWTDPDAGAELLGDYAGTWLAERRTPAGQPLKPRTAAHYRTLLDRHLLPTFGGMRLDAISPGVVNRWHRQVLPNGPTARAHAYSLLRTILGTAVADEVITRNPCLIRGGSAPGGPA